MLLLQTGLPCPLVTNCHSQHFRCWPSASRSQVVGSVSVPLLLASCTVLALTATLLPFGPCLSLSTLPLLALSFSLAGCGHRLCAVPAGVVHCTRPDCHRRQPATGACLLFRILGFWVPPSCSLMCVLTVARQPHASASVSPRRWCPSSKAPQSRRATAYLSRWMCRSTCSVP